MNPLLRYGLLGALLLGLGWFAADWQHEGRAPDPKTSGVSANNASASTDASRGKVGIDAMAANAQGPRPAGAGREQAAAAPRSDPITVNAVAATRRRIEDRVGTVGTLLAAQSVLIAPEIAGRITEVAVADGMLVSRGATLFKLDDDVVAAELAQAQAELDLAEANLKRTRNLARDNFVSERTREEAQSNVNVLRARLQVVAARQSRTRIVAPFDGVVGLVAIDVGDYVTPGMTLVRLDDLSTLKLDLRVPERLFARIHPGLPIRIAFDAYPERDFDARVETIDSQLDGSGRSLMIRGRIDNAERLLLPGMFARSQLVLAAREGAVMVPEESLESTSEGQHLFIVRDGKAYRTPVSTGARQDGQVEILTGVAAGDMVVTAGQIKLRGSAVPVTVLAPSEPRSTDVARAVPPKSAR